MSIPRKPHTTQQVLHEIYAGDAMRLGQLARYAPRDRRGRPAAPRTIVRWLLLGVEGPAGRVQLEAAMIAGRLVSSRGALARFFAARQGKPGASPAAR